MPQRAEIGAEAAFARFVQVPRFVQMPRFVLALRGWNVLKTLRI
jgi:hypothetical protein